MWRPGRLCFWSGCSRYGFILEVLGVLDGFSCQKIRKNFKKVLDVRSPEVYSQRHPATGRLERARRKTLKVADVVTMDDGRRVCRADDFLSKDFPGRRGCRKACSMALKPAMWGARRG